MANTYSEPHWAIVLESGVAGNLTYSDPAWVCKALGVGGTVGFSDPDFKAVVDGGATADYQTRGWVTGRNTYQDPKWGTGVKAAL